MTKQKIGIFGGGVLGNAMKQYFTEAKIFDKYQAIDPLAEVLNQDILFICVPTPYTKGKGFDLAEIDDVFSKLATVTDKIVVIRSTVLPGTTDSYQVKYPQHQILFNPEFLTEVSAMEDFLHPDKQIVGYTEKSQNVAEEVLAILPQAPYKKIMPAKEAEMIKYAVNNYYALKVIFANQVYDICQAAGINYETVKEGFVADKRVMNSHLEIVHKGYRGYGGKCLRKDMDSMIDFAQEQGIDLKLFKAARDINLVLNDGK